MQLTPVMTREQADWVFDNVYTPAIRKQYDAEHGASAARFSCRCQYGMTTWCQIGTHSKCQGTDRGPTPIGYLTNQRAHVLGFDVPYIHPHVLADGILGLHRDAGFWLAGRSCRWRCPCTCHRSPASLMVRPAAKRRHAQTPLPGQLDLFGDTV